MLRGVFHSPITDPFMYRARFVSQRLDSDLTLAKHATTRFFAFRTCSTLDTIGENAVFVLEQERSEGVFSVSERFACVAHVMDLTFRPPSRGGPSRSQIKSLTSALPGETETHRLLHSNTVHVHPDSR